VNSDLSFIDRLVSECFHQSGPGRPPRKPLGVFKALTVKRLLHIDSLRELERRLWSDGRLRVVCDIEKEEATYGRSVLSRFMERIGVDRLQKLIDHLLKGLKRAGVIKGRTVAVDATFIKAYSRIDTATHQGYSDRDAEIGKDGLGYNLHLAADTGAELPVAFTTTPANIRDITEAPALLKGMRRTLPRGVKHITADRGYSSDPFRTEVWRRHMEPVIPYRANQHKGEKGLLRIDRHFKPHGPTRLKRLYRKRTAVERVNSRLEEHFSLLNHRVRGLRNITLHIQLCIIAMLINAQAAINVGKPSKIRSPTYFAN
jgi:transposase